MGLFKRLFYLSPRQKLPRLRHHFTNGRKMDEWDEDVHILLEAGLMRDWSHARDLTTRRKKSADDLFWELSKAAKPNWQQRLKNRLIRAFGGLTYDPHKAELKRLSKGNYDYDGPHTHAYRILPSPRSRRIHSRRS